MTTSNAPVRLVYSYCHEDKAEMLCMKTALAPLATKASWRSGWTRTFHRAGPSAPL